MESCNYLDIICTAWYPPANAKARFAFKKNISLCLFKAYFYNSKIIDWPLFEILSIFLTVTED